MCSFDEALRRLCDRPCCGYEPEGPASAEPTALAAMALLAAGQTSAARQALDWLVARQAPDGSVESDGHAPRSAWPTGWAILAWRAGLAGDGSSAGWAEAAEKAVARTLAAKGTALPEAALYGHNTALQGWSWIEGTHSWVEPTAIHVMALRSGGLAQHPRCREGVALLLDRMLPGGGWNYGNTTVLGNTLRPHAQPTGLALAALAGEPEATARAARSADFLSSVLGQRTPTASLSYALVGLEAHRRRPAGADDWLAAALQRTIARDASPYKLALALLARGEMPCPWLAAREPHHSAIAP